MEDISVKLFFFFFFRMHNKLCELDALPTRLIKELWTVLFPSCHQLEILCKMIFNAGSVSQEFTL